LTLIRDGHLTHIIPQTIKQDMVRIAAERPIDPLTVQGEKEVHNAQALDGPADGSKACPNSSTDGAEAGIATSAIPGLLVQVQSDDKGAILKGGVEQLPRH